MSISSDDHTISAIIFDLDGVLIDSEQIWGSAKEHVAAAHGGVWHAGSARAMLGMSSPEWSRYMRETLGVDLAPREIVAEVVSRIEQLYREHLPLLPGALTALSSIGARWPLGLASSSNREIIELVLELAEVRGLFRAVVSSEEVAHGKPSPDVYLEAARRLGTDAARCVAVEDSTNGLRAAAATGAYVIAVPNRAFPPSDDALALASVTLESLVELSPEIVEGLALE